MRKLMRIVYFLVALSCGLTSLVCFFAWAMALTSGVSSGAAFFWAIFNLVFFFLNWMLFENLA